MSKKSLIIHMVICVAVAAIASFITFQVVTNQETESYDDNISKFGVSVKLKCDPSALDYSTTIYQNSTSFRTKIDALVSAPRSGT